MAFVALAVALIALIGCIALLPRTIRYIRESERLAADIRNSAERTEKAAEHAHELWVQSATTHELVADAIGNPDGAQAGRAWAEWHRRHDANMQVGIRSAMRTADAGLHE